jgi:glycosyltransferase involved in cell wall biosynthesis
VDRLAGDADIVHATGLLTPPALRPLVVTVHDVAAVRYPKLHPARHVRQQRTQLRALDRAAAILTVSQATADDLVQVGVRPERIVVAPLGLSSLPQAAAGRLTAERKRGYILTVGESSPRKRYDVVLRALTRVDRDLELVMAGPPAADEERLRSLVRALGLGRRVRRLGAVSDAALAGLYRDALALCFPSVAEGFGLPVLEAMAAGLPVVARDIPVARELAGDAAIYLAGDDERVWAEAIEALASDAELRERCSSAGRARAAEFTWDRTAAATLKAYRIAADGAP